MSVQETSSTSPCCCHVCNICDPRTRCHSTQTPLDESLAEWKPQILRNKFLISHEFPTCRLFNGCFPHDKANIKMMHGHTYRKIRVTKSVERKRDYVSTRNTVSMWPGYKPKTRLHRKYLFIKKKKNRNLLCTRTKTFLYTALILWKANLYCKNYQTGTIKITRPYLNLLFALSII